MKYLILIACLIPVLTAYASAGGEAHYVGSAVCEGCHQQQTDLWTGSHHDLAMQHADAVTVLADFSGYKFSYAGITTTFYKKDDKFMVRTDGADGKLYDYQVKYTFGVTPLQQYLVDLGDGKLQALSIAWDTRSKTEGGQRWFHLYPDEKITNEDELHWTRTNFNWNAMCAECHSTNLRKNYDAKTDAYHTTWSEIDVACEACHGPASDHITWAEKKPGWQTLKKHKGLPVLFDERKDVTWPVTDKTGNAKRSSKRTTEKEIEVCAQCHSRRSVISDDYEPGKPFLDHYMPRLLDEGMYFSDGQIQDEVYVYGSFLQSKMYHQGVTCSDCHEPHSLQLRQQGNAVCLQCHAAEKFDSEKHHFHKAGSTGALCAECHMPPTTYMVVDPRHDHSIRVPRPDLSVSLGVPNACNQCHKDKNASWAAAQVKQWYGKPFNAYQQYAEALDAGRKASVKAGELLAEQIKKVETPDIARASAIRGLSSYLDASSVDVLQKGLKDDNALVRLASVSALEGLPQVMLVQLAFPLINDPVRSVRIEVARVLASVPVGQLQEKQLKNYKHTMNEYIHSQMVNAERPEAQLNLGNYYAAQGDADKAIAAYTKAIKLEDVFMPAYINLADFYRVQKKESEAEKTLRMAISVAPENADVNYALGLLLVRQHKNDEAIKRLQRAAGFDSSNAHYVYVYAVALSSTGENSLAIDVLQDAQHRFPQDREILNALIAFHRDAGNNFAAQTFMKKLQKLNQ